MSAPVTVRRADPSDAARLAELSGVLGYPVPVDDMLERLGRKLVCADEAVLVAEDGSKHVVGWLHASEQEPLETGRRCEIIGLIVDPHCRGQGIGRELVRAIEAWASERGIDLVSVRSNVTREESHPFYERLGYVRAKTQHAYRKRLSEG